MGVKRNVNTLQDGKMAGKSLQRWQQLTNPMRLQKAYARWPNDCTALFVVNCIKLHLTAFNTCIVIMEGGCLGSVSRGFHLWHSQPLDRITHHGWKIHPTQPWAPTPSRRDLRAKHWARREGAYGWGKPEPLTRPNTGGTHWTLNTNHWTVAAEC